MNLKFVRILIITLALLTLGAAAFAQTSAASPSQATGSQSVASPAAMPGVMGHRFGPMNDMLAAYLRLTADQMSQVKAMRKSERTALRPLFQELASYRQQIRQATHTANFDENKISLLATQQSQVTAEITLERAQTEWKFYNLLSPDQQAQLIEFQSRMERRIQGRPAAMRQSP